MKNLHPISLLIAGLIIAFSFLGSRFPDTYYTNLLLDPDPPVAICFDTLQVFVDGNGIADVAAIDFDNGSTDNCPPLTFAVRRNDLNCDGSTDTFDPTAEFCCADIGTTDVEVTLLVVDGAGNFSACETVVEVQSSPVAICTFGNVIEIPSTLSYELNVNEVDDGSYDACGGSVELSFSTNPSDTTLIFDCDDLLNPQQMHTLWVTDQSGNQSPCEFFTVVQDNGPYCEFGVIFVQGLITTEEDEGIADVTVGVSGGLYFEVTDNNGAYQFDNLPPDNYWLFPTLDTDYNNGVSTYDMVLIRQHILSIQSLDSPYKMIAADANNSGSISTLDLVTIQLLVLGAINDFDDNTSWRFIDADYEFPNPDNPWEEVFPEGVGVSSSEQYYEIDFIGVKIGDVNNSAVPN